MSFLELKIAPQLQLELTLRGDDLIAALYRRRPKHQYNPHLLLAHGSVGDCRLHIEPAADYVCLWIRSACFRLTENQAAQVRTAFPGLRIARSFTSEPEVSA